MSVYRTLLIWLSVLVVAASTSFARPALADPSTAAVSQSLLNFEAAVDWSAVSDAWRTRRDAWVQEVQAAQSPQVLGRLTAELETAMTWDAVDESWPQQRDAWMAMMMDATSAQQVARGLLQLEENTKWSAVTDAWTGQRDNWVTQMKTVAGD